MLHRLNPVRLRYIREAIDSHWGGDGRAMRPACGQARARCRLRCGAVVRAAGAAGRGGVGIDAAPENIAAARAHSEKQGLRIDYRATGIEALGMAGQFDLVTSMEVIEHVTDPALFVRGLAEALAPGGLMILSTPNRTPQSRLMMIELGEGLGFIPRGTHDWSRFLKPEELTALLADNDLQAFDIKGIGFDPKRSFVLNDTLNLNYILSARKIIPAAD
jgi:2-polyprenyl-6-hydroxyphenyl methylase/3-demethylubiquinone-9 3-methyltransferase